jgi:hypothetical protein
MIVRANALAAGRILETLERRAFSQSSDPVPKPVAVDWNYCPTSGVGSLVNRG